MKIMFANLSFLLFIVDSKPLSVSDYLNDFITEATKLINKGVTINRKTYSFKIFGIMILQQEHL